MVQYADKDDERVPSQDDIEEFRKKMEAKFPELVAFNEKMKEKGFEYLVIATNRDDDDPPLLAANLLGPGMGLIFLEALTTGIQHQAEHSGHDKTAMVYQALAQHILKLGRLLQLAIAADASESEGEEANQEETKH